MENEGDDQNSLNIEGETVENTSKVAHDPGWNDPPKLTYGAMGQTKFFKKGLLNKRVSFPLNSNSQTTPSTSSLSATPPKGDVRLPLSSGDSAVDTSKSLSHKPFINPINISTGDTLSPKNDVLETLLAPSKPAGEPKRAEEKTPDESSLETVMNIFEKVISELMTPEECDRIEGDIRKRFEVMKKMWSEGKLCGAVQEKMMKLAEGEFPCKVYTCYMFAVVSGGVAKTHKLTWRVAGMEALQNGQGSMANDLHIEMIVDHTSQVSAWMPGVRKIVHCCMLAAERASKVEDNKVDLAAERNDDDTRSHETCDVDSTSG